MYSSLIGAHMSIAGGLHKAFARGNSVCCRTIQIFLKNSNRWDARPLSEDDRRLFAEAQRTTGIHPVVAHDSYLINLASPDPALREKSVQALAEEMRRANFLGVPGLVLHPGAHMGEGVRAGCRRVAEGVNRALQEVPPPVSLLLETTAGQGSSLGYRFEELAAVMERIADPDRVCVCFDTAHAFAAGYDLRTRQGCASVFEEFHSRIGIDKLRVFHLNDSRKDLGSRVDRHCHIGRGFLGLEAFRVILNDRRFRNIPKILETPKGPDLEEDRMNLDILESLCQG